MSTADKIIYCNFTTGERRCPEEARRFQDSSREDWRRFLVIQLHAYLSSKKSGRLGNKAEEDMIRDLLSVYWEEIAASGVLDGMSVLEKVKLFSSINVDFPVLEVPAPEGFFTCEG
jgi:hypothetical protein